MTLHRNTKNVDLDELIKQAREAGAEAARAEVRTIFAAVASPKPSFYSTRRGHAPAGYPDERWKAVAPTIPGAVRRGRWVVISREAVEAFEAAQLAPSTPAATPMEAAASSWSPGAALARAKLRAVR